MTESIGEYELFGRRVNFKPEASHNIDPARVVNLVEDEVARIRSTSGIQTSEALLLAALKFALDRIVLEESMKENITQLQSSAVDALRLIEKAIPTQTQAQS